MNFPAHVIDGSNVCHLKLYSLCADIVDCLNKVATSFETVS